MKHAHKIILETIVIALFAGLLGACVGSFLNVVIHRLPIGQSLVSPPCGHGTGHGDHWGQ